MTQYLNLMFLETAFPVGITAIDLTNEETTTIETFEVTWRYQHVEPSSVL